MCKFWTHNIQKLQTLPLTLVTDFSFLTRFEWAFCFVISTSSHQVFGRERTKQSSANTIRIVQLSHTVFQTILSLSVFHLRYLESLFVVSFILWVHYSLLFGSFHFLFVNLCICVLSHLHPMLQKHECEGEQKLSRENTTTRHVSDVQAIKSPPGKLHFHLTTENEPRKNQDFLKWCVPFSSNTTHDKREPEL